MAVQGEYLLPIMIYHFPAFFQRFSDENIFLPSQISLTIPIVSHKLSPVAMFCGKFRKFSKVDSDRHPGFM